MIAGITSNQLVEIFCSYYQTIAELKHAIASGREMQFVVKNERESASLTSAHPNDERVKIIAAYLHSVLDEISGRASDGFTEALKRTLNTVRYIMAALTDELLILEIVWWGNDYWEPVLLERKMFGTSSSGESFFILMDRLLGVANGNGVQKELAAIFLMAIALGFKGKYRNEKDGTTIDMYRKRLLRFIGRAGESEVPLFHDAYDRIVSFPEEKRLSPLSRWYRICLIFMVLYVIIAHFIWIVEIQPVNSYFIADDKAGATGEP